MRIIERSNSPMRFMLWIFKDILEIRFLKKLHLQKVKGRKLFFIRRIKKINVPFLSEIFVIYIRHIQNIKQYIGYREISGYEGLVACGERFMSYKEFMLYAVGRNIRISYGWSGIQILIPTGDFLF